MNKKKMMHSLLAKRLYGLLYCTNPTFFPSNNKSFIDLFEKELNILSYLDKTEAKKNDLGSKFLANSLVKKYNSLTKRDFVLSKKNLLVNGNKLEDLQDDINYLTIFCKNIFKINIDDIFAKVLSGKTSSGVSSTTNNQDNINTNSNYAFNSNPNPQFSNVVNNSYIYGLATSRAMSDFSLGKIYVYKTKPRIILILKIVMFVLLCLSCLASLTLSIVSIFVNRIPYGKDYVDFLWMGICFFVYSFICVYALQTLYKQIKMKNLNLKYSFSWSLILPYLFFSLMITFYFVQVIFGFEWHLIEVIRLSDYLRYVCCQIIRYAMITLFVLLVAVVVCCIIGIIFKPKKDDQIIKSTIDKYVDELSKSQPPFSA